MGTAEAYEALKALGGAATGAQISRWLLEKYPDLTYWNYYNISLKRLMKINVVKRDGDIYSINEKLPERNIVRIGKNGRAYRIKEPEL